MSPDRQYTLVLLQEPLTSVAGSGGLKGYIERKEESQTSPRIQRKIFQFPKRCLTSSQFILLTNRVVSLYVKSFLTLKVDKNLDGRGGVVGVQRVEWGR